MRKSDNVKERIIETTIDLIQKSNGNTENITIRNIAEKVGIGTGLINYHFGTKDKLIEICVQRIIANVISVFHPEITHQLDEIDRLKEVSKQVMDFLMANPEVSRISILGDLDHPKIMDNTMKTVLGFLTTFHTKKENIKTLTYCFTLILQGMFLRKDVTKESLGLDYKDKEERDAFIDLLIETMYR